MRAEKRPFPKCLLGSGPADVPVPAARNRSPNKINFGGISSTGKQPPKKLSTSHDVGNPQQALSTPKPRWTEAAQFGGDTTSGAESIEAGDWTDLAAALHAGRLVNRGHPAETILDPSFNVVEKRLL